MHFASAPPLRYNRAVGGENYPLRLVVVIFHAGQAISDIIFEVVNRVDK